MLLRPLRIRPLSTAGGTDRVAVRCNITKFEATHGRSRRKRNPQNAHLATYMTPALRTSTTDARMTREV
jgi:hypothetical protein